MQFRRTMDIVTFCASHISSEKRIPYLANAIESIVKQKHTTCMFVSVSYIDENLAIKLKEVLKTNNVVKVWIHANTTMSQFEHYDFLVQQIDPIFINKTWVMFTDDDDCSHNLRSKWFHIFTRYKERSCKSVLNPYILYYYDDKNITVENCHNALNTGLAKVLVSREYVAFCIKLRVLVDFLSIVKSHKLLKTYMCDVALSSLLYNITHQSDCIYNGSWAYAYNQHESHDRTSRKYDGKYYVKTYTKHFFADLADQFNLLNWIYCAGYTPIIHKEFFKKKWWWPNLFKLGAPTITANDSSLFLHIYATVLKFTNFLSLSSLYKFTKPYYINEQRL